MWRRRRCLGKCLRYHIPKAWFSETDFGSELKEDAGKHLKKAQVFTESTLCILCRYESLKGSFTFALTRSSTFFSLFANNTDWTHLCFFFLVLSELISEMSCRQIQYEAGESFYLETLTCRVMCCCIYLFEIVKCVLKVSQACLFRFLSQADLK